MPAAVSAVAGAAAAADVGRVASKVSAARRRLPRRQVPALSYEMFKWCGVCPFRLRERQG